MKPNNLPPTAQAFYRAIIQAPDKNMSHDTDWYPVYEFVNACHDMDFDFSFQELQRLLLGDGFHADAVRRIASVYEHGRKLLRFSLRAKQRLAQVEAQIKKAADG